MTDVGYSNDIVHEEQIRCPECREFIIKGARKCKHCGSQLSTEIDSVTKIGTEHH